MGAGEKLAMKTWGTTMPSLRAFGRWLSLACVLVFVAFPGAAFAAPTANDACLGCHGDPSKLRAAEPKDQRGVVVGLVIDPALLARSEHRDMACVDCHVAQTNTLPHQGQRIRFCLDCHRGDNAAPGGVHFGNIEREFKSSVHFERSPEVFKCTQCHNPHLMKRDITAQGVLAHNKVCLRCHGSPEEFGALVHKAPPDLDKAHSWLPNRDMHWTQVRCIDCHTSYEPLSSHLILPKEKAVHRCESCHAATTILTLKLYQYRRSEELKNVGILNGMIVNDSYVIGATRIIGIDIAMGCLIGAMLLGIAAHLFLRWMAGRRRARRATTETAGRPK